jgi:hypothetical protein
MQRADIGVGKAGVAPASVSAIALNCCFSSMLTDIALSRAIPERQPGSSSALRAFAQFFYRLLPC